MTLLATLHGLTIASAELALTRGLVIAQPDALGACRRPLAPGETRRAAIWSQCSALEDRDVSRALARGRGVLKDLLRALRLFGDGRVTLGALAWARVGDGALEPARARRGRTPARDAAW